MIVLIVRIIKYAALGLAFVLGTVFYIIGTFKLDIPKYENYEDTLYTRHEEFCFVMKLISYAIVIALLCSGITYLINPQAFSNVK